MISAIQVEPTPDLNPETLGALSLLLLAQAQEVFVHKAIYGKHYLFLEIYFLSDYKMLLPLKH